MNFKFIKQWLTIGCFSLAVISGLTQHTQAQQSRRRASFFCGTEGGQPATIARLPKNNGNTIPKTLIIWKIDDFKGYPPEKRCRLVSQKFQNNQNTGHLKYIVSGQANGWPVLCASKQNYDYIVDCPDPNVLMTLLPGDDSQDMIRKLEKLNRGRSNAPLEHLPDEVLVRSGNLDSININKWINNSPLHGNNSQEIIRKVEEPKTDIEESNQCIWGCE